MTSRSRKILRYVLWSALGLGLLMVAFLVGLHLFLSSPAQTAKMTPKISKYLREQLGLDVEIDSLAIDLIRHLEIRGIRASPSEGPFAGSLSIGVARVRYSPLSFLWSRTLSVSEVALEGINITGELRLDTATEPAPLPKVEASPEPLDLKSLLLNPPAYLSLRRLAVKDLTLKLNVHQPGTRAEIAMGPLHFDSSIDVGLGHAKLDYQVQLAEETESHLGAWLTPLPSTEGKKLSLKTLFAFDAKGVIELKADPQSMSFEITDLEEHLSLVGLNLSQKGAGEKTTVTLDRFDANFEMEGDSNRWGDDDNPLVQIVLPLEVDVLVDTKANKLHLQQSKGDKLIELTLDQFKFDSETVGEVKSLQDLVIETKLGSHNQIKLSGLELSTQAVKTKKVIRLAEQLTELIIKLEQGKLKNSLNVKTNSLDVGAPLTKPADIDLDFEAHTKNLAELIQQKGQLAATVELKGGPLYLEPLPRALTPLVRLDLEADLDQRTISLHQLVGIDDWNLLLGNLSLKDSKQSLEATGDWTITVDHQSKLHPALKSLAALGDPKVKTKFSLSLNHGKESLQDFDPAKDLANAHAKVSLDTQVSLEQQPTRPLLSLSPLSLKQTLDWSTKGLKHESQVNVARLALDDKLVLQDVQSTSKVSARSGLKPKDIDFALSTSVGAIKPQQAEVKKLAKILKDFRASLTGDIRKLQKLKIPKFEVRLGQKTLKIAGTVDSDLSKQVAFSEGELSLDLADFAGRLLDQAKGRVKLSWDATATGNKRFALESKLSAENLSLRHNKYAVSNIDGMMSLEEELRLTDRGLQFTHLGDRDPFQRVDYQRISPNLTDAEMRIEKAQMGETSFGPFGGIFGIEQNLVTAPTMRASLLGGQIEGALAINLLPEQASMGFKGLFTRLDLSHLEEGGAKTGEAGSISGSMAVEIDLVHSLIEGQVHMTEIDQRQLIKMLNILDPKREDDRIQAARSALALGHPSFVEVIMKYGLMHLRLDVATPVGTNTVHVRGIELSRFMAAFGAPIKKALASIPVSAPDEQVSQN